MLLQPSNCWLFLNLVNNVLILFCELFSRLISKVVSFLLVFNASLNAWVPLTPASFPDKYNHWFILSKKAQKVRANCKQTVSSVLCLSSALHSKQSFHRHGCRFLFTQTSAQSHHSFSVILCFFLTADVQLLKRGVDHQSLTKCRCSFVTNLVGWGKSVSVRASTYEHFSFTHHKCTVIWVLCSPWAHHSVLTHLQLRYCYLPKDTIIDSK